MGKWTVEEIQELTLLQERGLSKEQIGRAVGGRTANAINVKLRKIGRGERAVTGSSWSAADLAMLVNLRENYQLGWDAIGRRMGKPSGTVYSKYRYLKWLGPVSHSVVTASRPSLPESVEADWRRRQALSPRDLTAALCGDPLPGFSALERRA